MTETELELFRLRVRLHLVERLMLKAYVTTFSVATGMTHAISRDGTIKELERYEAQADEAYLRQFGVATGALLTDEFREIVGSMKSYLRSMPV